MWRFRSQEEMLELQVLGKGEILRRREDAFREGEMLAKVPG